MTSLKSLMRFRFGRFRALLVKETRLILRDPSYLVIGLGLPLLMLFLYGFGISMDIRNVPAEIVLEERSPAAHALMRRFEANGYLRARQSSDPERSEALFSTRGTEAILRIQPGFARDVEKGEGEVGITLYGVDSNTAQMVRSYAAGILGTALNDSRLSAATKDSAPARAPVNLTSRLWFNEAADSTWYLVPGILIIVTSVSASFLGSLLISRECERGTLSALFATPASSLEILLSKLVPCAGIALLGFFLCLFMAIGLFEVPLRGSVLWLMTTAFLYTCAAAAFGLFISAKVKSQFLATEISIMASFLPTMMLSGFLFDLRSVPVWIEWIGRLFPPSYALESVKICFLSGGNESALVMNALFIGLSAVLFFMLTLKLLGKSPARTGTKEGAS